MFLNVYSLRTNWWAGLKSHACWMWLVDLHLNSPALFQIILSIDPYITYVLIIFWSNKIITFYFHQCTYTIISLHPVCQKLFCLFISYKLPKDLQNHTVLPSIMWVLEPSWLQLKHNSIDFYSSTCAPLMVKGGSCFYLWVCFHLSVGKISLLPIPPNWAHVNCCLLQVRHWLLKKQLSFKLANIHVEMVVMLFLVQSIGKDLGYKLKTHYKERERKRFIWWCFYLIKDRVWF